MNNDNKPMGTVVEFPKKIKDALSQEQEELRAAHKALELVNTQRKSALETLAKKMELLQESDKLNVATMSPGTVEVLRDVRAGLDAAATVLKAHDTLIDMITHDLVGVVQNLEAQANHTFQTSAFVQTILEVLKDRGMVTQDEMKAKWTEIVKAQSKEPSPE